MFARFARFKSTSAFVLAASLLFVGCDDNDDDDDKDDDNGEQRADAATPDAAVDGSTSDAAIDTGAAPGTETHSLALLNEPARKVIDQLAALGGKPIETLTPEEARKQPTPSDAVKKVLESEGKSTAPEPVGSVADQTIPGPDGMLPIRVYKPVGMTGELPIVVYYHGGGWVIATIDTYDSSARALANAAGAVLVSVEYRKGPEVKFPGAHDDAYAAYKWVVQNAATLGGSATRIAVAGESAGGNLALNVAIAARDEGIQQPLHALLVYPVASTKLDAPSYVEHERAKPLNKAMITWFTGHYFRTEADGKDPRISLVDANLKGLPPTTIINAEVDPLRSDGEALTAKLKDAQVKVTQQTFAGVPHEFFGMGAVVPDAKSAVKLGADHLIESLKP